MMEGRTILHIGVLCCVLEKIFRKEASSGGIKRTCAEADNTGGESNTVFLEEPLGKSSRNERDVDSM